MVIIVLSVILAAMANEIYVFWSKNRTASEEYAELQKKLSRARADYENLQVDLQYYLNPYNLEKELRSRFNYAAPGEKLIILVSPSTSSVSSTNP